MLSASWKTDTDTDAGVSGIPDLREGQDGLQEQGQLQLEGAVLVARLLHPRPQALDGQELVRSTSQSGWMRLPLRRSRPPAVGTTGLLIMMCCQTLVSRSPSTRRCAFGGTFSLTGQPLTTRAPPQPDPGQFFPALYVAGSVGSTRGHVSPESPRLDGGLHDGDALPHE